MEGVKNLLAHKTEKITKQTPVECLVNLDGELDKVLAINGNCEISSFDLYEKEAKLNGEILVSVLYKTDQDELNTVTTNCNFQDTIKNDLIMPENKVFAKCKLVGINPTVGENNTIKLIATVEMSLDMVENCEVESYYSNNEVVCQKTDEIDINVFCGLNCADFDVNSTSTTGENIKKVLSLDSSSIVSEVTSGDGFVSVGGQICSYIVALTEDNKFKSFQICNDFKEEIEFADLKPESVVDVFVRVKKDGVKVSLEETGEQMNLIIDTPVKVCARAYNTEKFEVVQDIYSTKNELELEKNKYKNLQIFKPKYFEAKIEGNLSLSEDEPRIDKVLASSCPTLTITNSYFDDGQIIVEGVVNTNVIYLNDDENKINSVEMEIPFKVSEKTNFEDDNIEVDAYAVVCDCDCIAKRGREIYYDCKLKVYVQLYTENEYEILTAVQEGRVFPQNDSSIEIYFAKTGDTFWDIAKELKITEDMLLTQNPDLVSPLEKDEKVVVYYNL